MTLKSKKNDIKSFYIESLGCPRNLVDSEVFAGILKQKGYRLTDTPLKADFIVINTCGFIKDAKEESIGQILELAEYKKVNNAQLIVTGCLVQRYASELRKSFPEVDYFVGLKDFTTFAGLLSLNDFRRQRFALDNLPYAYLRISDGCNNLCSYCAIPSIRGRLRSEPVAAVINEAKQLAETGVKELIITAMDITQYGADWNNQTGLSNLLASLSDIKDIHWIRLLYLHPAHLNQELLFQIRDNPKICNYIDLPIQHINDSILKRMNRHINRKEIEQTIALIRKIIPQAALRTTLMTGFPGETEKHFDELKDFVIRTEFNRLGVFQYSREEGTKAYNLSDRVHHQTAQRRKRELTEIHDLISEKLLQRFVGQTLEVIIERSINGENDGDYRYEGRTRYDAPDIDGLVFLKAGSAQPEIGDIVTVEIRESQVHDLIGVIK